MFDKLSLNAACKAQYKAVLAKGFEHQPIATKLMLIVSELSEAMEADRHNRHADIEAFEKETPDVIRSIEDDAVLYRKPDGHLTNKEYANAMCKHAFENHIKNTFDDEIADAFLRLMALCGEYGIDIERLICMKAAYNQTRPIKHGKAY